MRRFFKIAVPSLIPALLLALILVSAAFLLAGWFLFSPDRIRSGVASILSGKEPVSDVAISSCRPVFPPGIRMSGMSVKFKRGTSLEAREVILRPRFASLLGGRLSLDFDAGAYGGRIRGKLDFLQPVSASGPFRLALNFEDIRVAECRFLDSLTGLRTAGIARGSLDYRGRTGRLSQGEGALRVAVREADFKSRLPVLARGFHSAEAEASWQGNTLNIQKLHLTGQEVQGDFRGRIFLHEDFPRSRLLMKGDFAAIGDPGNVFFLVVTGTVAEPAANLM